MNTQDIIDLEEQVMQLTSKLIDLHTQMSNAPACHYGEQYNYLGTLKVNLLSLERWSKRAAGSIKINC